MELDVKQEPARIGDKAGLFALTTASLLALLSASCCVLPIGLSILGVGGSWLAILGPFAANRSLILVGVGIVIGLAWLWLIWRAPCARQRRAGILAAVVGASGLFVIALSAPLWEQDAARFLFEQWRLLSR
ncbi:MAG: hypothetical protein AcusKO_28990 [Acuticoccus sp.]